MGVSRDAGWNFFYGITNPTSSRLNCVGSAIVKVKYINRKGAMPQSLNIYIFVSKP